MNGPTRPTALPVEPANIPRELQRLPRWVVWRWEQRKGKWTKPPRRADDDGDASTTDPATWSTFEAALAAYRDPARRLDGIGICLTARDRETGQVVGEPCDLAGADLDHVIDPDTGAIADHAREVVRRLDSYTERSPSGLGLRVIVRGSLPPGGRQRDDWNLELYDHGRYLTITGHQLDQTPGEVRERTAQLAALHAELWPPRRESAQRACPVPVTLDDAELLRRASAARNGARFDALWRGDTSGYASHSEADLALVSLLAFWTGGDADRMDRLFRQSGMMREKWSARDDYRSATLAAALEDRGPEDYYHPPSPPPERTDQDAPRRATSAAFVSETVPEGPDEDDEDEAPVPPAADEVERFPVEVLPVPVARFVLEAADSLPCPPDFVGVPVLAILGAAIGNRRVIAVKPGWHEGALLYTAVVAEPGSKKSPALALASIPLREAQDELQLDYERAKDAHQDALAEFDQAQQDYQRYLKQRARYATRDEGLGLDASGVTMERPRPPEEPLMGQVYTTDATLEALVTLLKGNPLGLLLLRDELTGWARGMDQYRNGKGADRQAWLSFWSSAPVVVNRKGERDPVVIRRPFVAVAGCLPPGMLSDLSDEHGREDGFVHRVLFAYPDRVPVRWVDTGCSEAAVDGYRRVYERLTRLAPLADESGSRPLAVGFTWEGRTAFVAWANEHYAELADDLLPENLRGPWSKFEGYCARLALILHASRLAADEAEGEAVDEISVQGAAALIGYFKSHARRVYRLLRQTPQDQRMEQAVAWIRKQDGRVSLRQLLRAGVAGVGSSAEARSLLESLETFGHGTISTGERKDSLWFTLREVSRNGS